MKSLAKLRITLVFLSLFTLFIFSSLQISADFSEDYQNYLKIYDGYRNVHNQYLTARNQYLTYGTLNSKNEALITVRNFLDVRDKTFLTYINLLKSKNSNSELETLLDDQIGFVTIHQQNISPLASLEDAVNLSLTFEEKHVEFQLVSRKVTGSLLVSKIESLKNRFQTLLTTSENLIITVKNQGKNVSILERWLIEAKGKQLISDQKLNIAAAQITTLNSRSLSDLVDQYIKIQVTILEAHQYLREAVGYLNELSQSIKYGNY